MLVLGFWRYCEDCFNIFDGTVELMIGSGDNVAVLAFGALRLMTVLRLLHKITPLRMLLNSVLDSLFAVWW